MQRAHEKDLCLGDPATDGCPVGSLRCRAPVQGPAGIGARPFDSAEGRFKLKLAWFAGVDWGFQKHQACVLDAAGKVLGEREFEHGGAGLSQMADWLLSFATGDAGEVGVAIETPRGPVVESLMERGFAVHSINPKQLDRFRDGCGSSSSAAQGGLCERHGKSYLSRRRRGGEGGGGGSLTGGAIPSAYSWAWCRWYSCVVEVSIRIEDSAGS